MTYEDLLFIVGRIEAKAGKYFHCSKFPEELRKLLRPMVRYIREGNETELVNTLQSADIGVDEELIEPLKTRLAFILMDDTLIPSEENISDTLETNIGFPRSFHVLSTEDLKYLIVRAEQVNAKNFFLIALLTAAFISGNSEAQKKANFILAESVDLEGDSGPVLKVLGAAMGTAQALEKEDLEGGVTPINSLGEKKKKKDKRIEPLEE